MFGDPRKLEVSSAGNVSSMVDLRDGSFLDSLNARFKPTMVDGHEQQSVHSSDDHEQQASWSCLMLREAPFSQGHGVAVALINIVR
ncbi:hypothetical protein V6N12_067629 [Hibiscus sabdariffa]|uniref:Uncharacterized protein n=1 Tax=Hibiscus sabdariffa TaxID=183260 RepID=A0ABR2A7R1_9ROSI